MGCSSSKETAATGFTERKGPDVSEQNKLRQQATRSTKQSTTLRNEHSDDTGVGGDCNPHAELRTTETVTLKLRDLQVRYACYSKKGRDPDSLTKPNQDSYSHHGHGGFTNDTTDNHDAFFGVYDGHGPTGDDCSKFVRIQLPKLIKSSLEDHFSLNSNIIQDCLHQAHLQCNRALHAEKGIDDSYSGTTSCCLLLQPTRVTMANVGDSRCILGTQQNGAQAWKAVALSNDQTPRRSDEAGRCQKAGARILSFSQIYGDTKEDVEDPPRVWAPDGNYPGTAFTRSLGDRVAKKFGVCAEPEVLGIQLSKNEKCLIIGSDGIWDVLSNQQIVNICQKHHGDPYQACQDIVTRSHEEWLKNDLCMSADDPNASYDDMTVIVIMLGEVEEHEKKTNKETGKEQAATDSKTEQPKKRVRQKTLRHVEDGPKEDAFFVGSMTAPATDAGNKPSEADKS